MALVGFFSRILLATASYSSKLTTSHASALLQSYPFSVDTESKYYLALTLWEAPVFYNHSGDAPKLGIFY